ncbi:MULTISPECIES: hypothetical protein [Streptomyces]|nr:MULTISPECIES: hypothetical protein [Streptomyces]
MSRQSVMVAVGGDDLKDWETTRDGKPLPLPSEQPMRYRTTAQAEQWDDGRWRVIQYTQHGEQTC